jgi:hypothetical protein
MNEMTAFSTVSLGFRELFFTYLWKVDLEILWRSAAVSKPTSQFITAKIADIFVPFITLWLGM